MDAGPAVVPDGAVRLADDDSCFCPVMIRARDGFMVAWNCADKIMVNRLDDSGAPVGPAQVLSEGWCPAITTSADAISVVWMSSDSIQLARFDDGGSLIEDPVVVVPLDTHYIDAVNVSVAADASGHALVWSEAPSGPSRRIRFAGLDGDGTLVAGPLTLAPEEEDPGPDGPAIAPASEGFVAVWYEPETIEMHHLARDGTELEEATAVEAMAPNRDSPDNEVSYVFAPLRLVSDDTNVVVGWPFSQSQVRVHVASTATPAFDGGVTTILPTNVDRVPSIATATSPDGYLAVWSSGRSNSELPGSEAVIQWAYFDDGGQQVGPLGFVRADAEPFRHAIAAAYGDGGYVLVFATRDGGLFALPLPS